MTTNDLIRHAVNSTPGSLLDDPSIPLWVRTCAFLETLDVQHGALMGEPFGLAPFQIDVVRALCDPLYELVALSIARANGKTTLLGAIAMAAMVGPLAIPNTIIPVVASDKTQAGICVDHALMFLKPWRLAEPQRFTYRSNKDEMLIIDRHRNIEIQAVSADPRSKHGASFALAICDEPAQWAPNGAEKVFNAMMTSRGKQAHSRVVIIGTQPDDDRHFFSKALRAGQTKAGRDAGTWSALYAADQKAKHTDWKQIEKANPLLPSVPALRETIKKEMAAVKNGTMSLSSFKAYRMNMGTSEVADTEYLLGENTLEIWKSCYVKTGFDVTAPRRGDMFLGLDVGQAVSLTAAIAYWPETGRMETYAGLPVGAVTLEEREKADAAKGIYTAAVEQGELITFPKTTTPIDQFLKHVLKELNGWQPVKVFADRYKKAEVEQVLAELKVNWVPAKKVTWRGAGAGPDGHTDIQNFIKEVMEGNLKTKPSALWLHALRDARIKRDTNQNASLDKSRSRARIDVVQAGVMAISAGWQSRLADPNAKGIQMARAPKHDEE